MLSKQFDGSQRNHFFQRVTTKGGHWPPFVFAFCIVLDIEVFHIERIFFDELAPGLDVFAH